MPVPLGTLLLPVGLLACGGKADPLETGDDGLFDGGYSSIETGTWEETGKPDDTGDGGGGADGGGGGDGGGDTGGDGGTPAPVATALALWPAEMAVIPGAMWDLRPVVTWDDGTQDVATEVTYEVDAPEIVAVDAGGRVQALAPGLATITAVLGEQRASVPVTVQGDDLVLVTVVAAESGAPLAGARVRVGLEETKTTEGTTDAHGRIALPWAGTDPFVVTAWDRYRAPVTVFGAVHRQLLLPVRAVDDIDEVLGGISGNVDLSGVPDGGFGDLKVGVVLPSLVRGPLVVDTRMLAGPERTMTVYGVEAEIPANVYVRDVNETYELYARAGTTGLWTMSAPLPIEDVTRGLAGATDIIAVMLSRLSDVAWTFEEGVPQGEGEHVTVDLAPATALTELWNVDAGPLSVGFSGDEDALVMVGELLPAQGFAPFGIGVGTELVPVFAADATMGGTGPLAMAVAQVGGLGAGDGYGICTTWGPATEDDTTLLRELQQVPALHRFEPSDQSVALETDGRVQFVHAVLRGGGDASEIRDLYFDGGPWKVQVPNLDAPFGWGSTRWEILALETAGPTFQDFLARGWPDDAAVAAQSWTAGQLTQEP